MQQERIVLVDASAAMMTMAEAVALLMYTCQPCAARRNRDGCSPFGSAVWHRENNHVLILKMTERADRIAEAEADG